jgi:hypothetical protein
MTEAEWVACTKPRHMLDSFLGNTSDRKWRLFAVACCRRIWENMIDKRSREAVDVAERLADRLASKQDCSKAFSDAGVAAEDALIAHAPPDCLDRSGSPIIRVEGFTEIDVAEAAAEAAQCTVYPPESPSIEATCMALSITPSYTADVVYALHGFSDTARREEEIEQCRLVRDILGNPFCPVTFDPSWRASTISDLARIIYDNQAFSRIRELANALEQSGCINQDILQHCHQQCQHVRGCWVIDLILEKK